MTTASDTPKDSRGLSDHKARMATARRLATWELGYSGWADRIIGAYLAPGATIDYLDDAQGNDR